MRKDMCKVIVERPRGYKGEINKARRRRDDVDGPSFLGMRAGYGYRALNENLKPLERYLHAQVGRPWDKVHSEICANIDRRNTVQQHVLEHLRDMIAVQVEWRDGRWVDLKDRDRWRDPRSPYLRQKLYVDPRTGLIRTNKQYRTIVAAWRERATKASETSAQNRRRVDEHTLLLRIAGLWYQVRLEPMPPGRIVEFMRNGTLHRGCKPQWVFDVVLKKKVCREQNGYADESFQLCGVRYTYAASKQQLSRKEMDRYDLPRPAD